MWTKGLKWSGKKTAKNTVLMSWRVGKVVQKRIGCDWRKSKNTEDTDCAV
jgi:hypothetical protein